uniref:Nicotinamide N-methyltransferase n=1 Tax=Peronospora matthiolae TaxID=2874970 RepID=A0AAV1TKE5_9STRA
MEGDDGTEGVLTDVGFMFDACLEKVTCRYDYGENGGNDVSVLLTYTKDEPGALQSGHYVWPAAPALCQYLVTHQEIISKEVIEHNVRQQERRQATCFTQSLRWGPDGVKEIEALEHVQTGQVDGDNARGTQLIVASDVIYAQEVVVLLFWTVDRLLSIDGVFLMCSSFRYDDETENEIDTQSLKWGLEREIIECLLDEGGTRIQRFTRRK